MSEIKVKDSVVFVTGANRGIGRAIAEEALERGSKKVYAAARDVSGVSDLVERHPGRVVAIQLDVTNSAQIDSAASAAQDVQILINNAGVLEHGRFVDDRSGAASCPTELRIRGFRFLEVAVDEIALAAVVATVGLRN